MKEISVIVSAIVQKWNFVCVQKWTGFSEERMSGENGGPDRVFGIWRVRENPETKTWMEDNGDGFQRAGRDGVGVAEDFYGVIASEATGEDNGEMKIKEGSHWSGPQKRAFFAFGFAPGGIGSGVDGAYAMACVVSGQEVLQEGVGRGK